jgi:hypothetical protein
MLDLQTTRIHRQNYSAWFLDLSIKRRSLGWEASETTHWLIGGLSALVSRGVDGASHWVFSEAGQRFSTFGIIAGQRQLFYGIFRYSDRFG